MLKAVLLQEYFEVWPVAGQGRAGPVQEEAVPHLFASKSQIFNNCSSTCGFQQHALGKSCQIRISACPFVFTLCLKYVEKKKKPH